MSEKLESPESYLSRLATLFPTLEVLDTDDEKNTHLDHDKAVDEVASPSRPLIVRVRRFTAQHMKVLAGLALVAVILSTWMVMRARTVPLEEPTSTPTWIEQSETPTIEPPWLIHVVGEVVNPGVVEVSAGARVIDAIQSAGGLTSEADPGDLNLAAVLIDGCQVVIGSRIQPLGEVRWGVNGDQDLPSTSSEPSGSSSKLNLNQATEAELDTLPGVGPVTAKAIIAWREENGSFSSVSQLQEVNGVGPKTFAQIEPFVTI